MKLGAEIKKRGKGAALLLVGFAAGVAIGVGGAVFFQGYNPPDDRSPSASVVFERFVDQGELVSVSQKYNIVDKYVDTNTFFDLFDIPFTENSIWYRYSGIIKAGVNIENAEIIPSETSIRVVLDQPYIVSNDPDMDVSGVLEENGNFLNPVHVGDVDDIHRECIRISEEEAIAGGLFDEAKKNAEGDITRLFKAALGDEYTVDYEWREEQ